MKNLILLSILVVLTSIQTSANVYVIPVNMDPCSPMFVLYYNDKLSIEATRIDGYSMEQMFGKDLKWMDRTTDSVYWVINPYYYKLWWPEYQMMFTIRPIKGRMELGNHLIMFLKIIRDQRKQSKQLVHN